VSTAVWAARLMRRRLVVSWLARRHRGLRR